MPELTTVAKRILQLKGNMSYAELAEDIYRRTGKRISANGLQGLGSGARMGRPSSTIAILAEYAGKPLAWFYEDDAVPNTVAEARAEYHASEDEKTDFNKYKDLLADLNSLSPEEQEAVKIMIKSMASAKKEQAAMGE